MPIVKSRRKLANTKAILKFAAVLAIIAIGAAALNSHDPHAKLSAIAAMSMLGVVAEADPKKITIKHLFGKNKDKVEEMDAIAAKSLIDAETAVVVTSESELDLALKDFQTKLEESTAKSQEKLVDAVYKKSLERVLKAIEKSQRGEIVVGEPNEFKDGTGGFKSASHFYNDVKNASLRNGHVSEELGKWNKTFNDMELATKASTGNTEGTTTADAGFAVPVEYKPNIFSMYGTVPNFRDGIFQVPMGTNVTQIPVLKNYDRSNTTVTAGVVAAVVAEQTNITTSRTNWEQITLTLKKEAIIVPVTNELLEDNNVALGTVVNEQAGYQIQKAINGGIIKGSSAYTGIIGHAATIHQNRSVINQVNFLDVMGMYAKFAFDDASWEGATWFCSPTVLPQLANMTSGNYNIYFPPGGARDMGVGMLLGRPIRVTGWCAALGSPGDLLLCDMRKYVGGYRGGLKSFISPHVYFLSDEMAFRFTERVTGRPGLSGPITLEDGTTTVSPFIQLGSVIGGS